MIRERITRSSDVLKERRRRLFVKFLWVALGLILLLIALGFVSHIDKLLLKDVKVSGNEILEEEEMKEKTFEILEENLFFIFARDNKFIYSKKDLSLKIMQAFPRILTIEITNDGEVLHYNISERERAFLWCGENAPVYEERFSDKDCYFLDDSGFIFDVAPKFSSGIYFTFYTDIQDGNPIGQSVLNPDSIKEVGSLVKLLKEKDLPADSFVEKADGQYELLLDMTTTTGSYAKILFASDQTIGDVYNKINSVIPEDPFKTDFLEKRSKLEYIDARFKNRVFYRFKDSEPNAI